MKRPMLLAMTLSVALGAMLPSLARAQALPDLSPAQIITTTLYPGVANQITVLINDTGSTSATDFTATSFSVTLQANGTLVDTRTVNSDQPWGWPAYVSFNWTPAAAGTYTLLVNADSGNVIHESNETNNTLSEQVQVLPLAPVTVNVRVEGKSSTVWDGQVTFETSSITDNTGTIHSINRPTAIGALDAAAGAGGFSYVATNSWGSLFVTTIGGDASLGADGWQYRVDWVLPSVGAADYALGPGDHEVLWYYGPYDARPLKLNADKATLQATASLGVTVEAFDDISSSWSPLASASVHAGGQSFTTDASGQAHFTLPAGHYSIWADKGDYTQYVRSNRASVQVRSGSDLPALGDALRQYPGNPIIDLGATGAWNESGSSAASVIHDGYTYKMWFTGTRADGARQIGYATSIDGEHWSQYSGNPVMTPGPTESWDALGVGSPWVLKSGSTYKMWFTGYALVGAVQVPTIGYATSSDGVSWTPYASNPVVTQGARGSFSESGVLSPSVMLDGATLKMWYTAGSGGLDTGTLSIGYAESADGLVWSQYSGNPVLSPDAANAWEARGVGQASVVKDGSAYYAWYTGISGTGASLRTTIVAATSTDGKSWTKSAANPVMSGSAGSWTATGVGSPRVLLQTANLLRVWYSGADGAAAPRLGFAFSVDLDGRATLQGGGRPAAGRLVSITVSVYTQGADVLTATPLASAVVTAQDNGTSTVGFAVSSLGVPPGVYDITVRSAHTLTNVKRNVAITPPNVLDLGTLLEGDANDSGVVNIQDFSILAASYLKTTGQPGFNPAADFDNNGVVNMLDFSLLAADYAKTSPVNIP